MLIVELSHFLPVPSLSSFESNAIGAFLFLSGFLCVWALALPRPGELEEIIAPCVFLKSRFSPESTDDVCASREGPCPPPFSSSMGG